MKYVHSDLMNIEAAWLTKADAAKTEALAKPDEKATQVFISSKSGIWAELKPTLESLSDGKCWYSEAKDRVSYWEVDHFRPKKLYPWLAFDWKNFRLCGGNPIERRPMSSHLKTSPAGRALTLPTRVQSNPSYSTQLVGEIPSF
jgi:hypothetical protein